MTDSTTTTTPTIQQRQATLDYWDTYHAENDTKEWILQPTQALLRQICRVPTQRSWLEIGCGTSTMARELFRHLVRQANGDVHVCATDVSPVCIAACRQRDASQTCTSHTLQYRVWNVIDQAICDDTRRWHVVFDKGCLDTFLFRTRQRGNDNKHSPIVAQLLDHVHANLCDDDGTYLVVSPRGKIRALRDYNGFTDIRRIAMANDEEDRILHGNGKKTQSQCYLYVCTKNCAYVPGEMEPYRYDAARRTVPSDDEVCGKCGTTFVALRKDESMQGRGEAFWTRQWRGHVQHCKGGVDAK